MRNGLVAEWLGGGLQNHLQRFESARDLQAPPNPLKNKGFFYAVSGCQEFTLCHSIIGSGVLIRTPGIRSGTFQSMR